MCPKCLNNLLSLQGLFKIVNIMWKPLLCGVQVTLLTVTLIIDLCLMLKSNSDQSYGA